MVKEYIYNDPEYPEFRGIKNKIYQEIENNSRANLLINEIVDYSRTHEEYPDLSEKDVKRFFKFNKQLAIDLGNLTQSDYSELSKLQKVIR